MTGPEQKTIIVQLPDPPSPWPEIVGGFGSALLIAVLIFMLRQYGKRRITRRKTR